MALVVNVWSKVAVAVQTVLAAPKVVTAITKANPAVVSIATHGYLAGDAIVLKVSGMSEINYGVFEVANPTAGTLELKGVDSTLFNTFTSGTAELITFGAAAATITDVSQSGGENQPIPSTTIHDDTDKEVPGNNSAISYNFTNIWDPADPALVELRKAYSVKGDRALRLTFATGAKVYFDAYPSVSLAPGGSAGGLVTTPSGFKLRGPITSYAS